MVWGDERSGDGILRWLDHVGGMENDRMVKRMHVVECADSRVVGQLRKSWIDTVKIC